MKAIPAWLTLEGIGQSEPGISKTIGRLWWNPGGLYHTQACCWLRVAAGGGLSGSHWALADAVSPEESRGGCCWMSYKDTAFTSRGRIQWLPNKEDAANKHGTCETKCKREFTATASPSVLQPIPASLQQTPQGVALLSPNRILIHFLSVSQGPGPAQPL